MPKKTTAPLLPPKFVVVASRNYVEISAATEEVAIKKATAFLNEPSIRGRYTEVNIYQLTKSVVVEASPITIKDHTR